MAPTMSSPLSPNVASALRLSAEAQPRLGAGGLSSPGAVAGQFAAMLASLRDGAGESGDGDVALAGVSQPFGSVAATKSAGNEHKVALSAVSLLLQDMGEEQPVEAASEEDGAPRRRAEPPADVSDQVVAQTVATGAPTDGRWMAMLMASGQPADVAA